MKLPSVLITNRVQTDPLQTIFMLEIRVQYFSLTHSQLAILTNLTELAEAQLSSLVEVKTCTGDY